MVARIIGVFKLDVKVFEEIEHETSLTLPAAIIVLLVSLVSGFGNGLFNTYIHRTFMSGFIGAVISVLLGWLLWSTVTWFVGTRFFKGEADLVNPTSLRNLLFERVLAQPTLNVPLAENWRIIPALDRERVLAQSK